MNLRSLLITAALSHLAYSAPAKNATLPTHPNVNTGAKVRVFVEDEKCQFDFQDVAGCVGRTYEAVGMGKFDLESKKCIQSDCECRDLTESFEIRLLTRLVIASRAFKSFQATSKSNFCGSGNYVYWQYGAKEDGYARAGEIHYQDNQYRDAYVIPFGLEPGTKVFNGQDWESV